MNIRKHIPNAITSFNLLCGMLGIALTLCGNVVPAFAFMLLGAVADFFDGFAARLLGAYSPMGKELDSQADQVTFGVLPSLMLIRVMLDFSVKHPEVFPDNIWLKWAIALSPALIAVFSGLRLAKFNIDERQTTSFLGLPTPACAIVCGAYAAFLAHDMATSCGEACCNGACGAVCPGCLAVVILVPLCTICLCALLVSEIPMFSMKLHKGDKAGWQRISFFIVAALSIVTVIVLKAHWTLAFFGTFAAYILINLISAIFSKKTQE